jgi:non-heme chloroperoxidase
MPYHIAPDGVPLYYVDEGQGRPLVLVHGWTMNHTFFERNIGALAKTHRVIALDLRAHGHSGVQELGWTLPQAARDLHALLKALNVTGATVAGWSMGTSVIHHYVEQFGGDRLSGAVFVDMTPFLFMQDDWTHGVFGTMDRQAGLELERDIIEDRLAFEEAFIPACFAGGQPPDAETKEHWIRRSMLTPTAAVLAYWVSMSAYDWREQLSRFPVPVLLCYGARSAVYPNDPGSELARRLPESELIVFERSGHSPFFEEPEKFNAEVARFAR